jgi:hypothetical protein
MNVNPIGGWNIRQGMIAILVIALALALGREIVSNVPARTIWLIPPILVFAVTKWLTPGWIACRFRRLALVLFVTSLLFSLYGIWAHYRILYHTFFLDHPFPHPDATIMALGRWFAIRSQAGRPHTPGALVPGVLTSPVQYWNGCLTVLEMTATGLFFGIFVKARETISQRSVEPGEDQPRR